MHCPACGLSVPSNNVSTALGAARCTACDTLFEIGSGAVVQAGSRGPRAALATPPRWHVEDTGRETTVRWRWANLSGLLVLPFALFWNGLLATFGWSATEGGAHPERLLFGLVLPHVWVGLGLFYWAFAALLNTTTMRLVDGKLTVRHAPLPWPGGRLALPREDVRQLFVLERSMKNTTAFDLCALMRDGRRKVVVRSLPSLADAQFLETKFERQLDLVDQAVAGEAKKG